MKIRNNHIRIVAVIWCIAWIIVGFQGCIHNLEELSKPLPIGKDNIPTRFYVVGISEPETPQLFIHEVSLVAQRLPHSLRGKPDQRNFLIQDEFTVLWSENIIPDGQLSFYLDPDRIQKITDKITDGIQHPMQRIKITVHSDDKELRTQRLEVLFIDDDFSYTSVYDVEEWKITPIVYGDLTKRDGFKAFTQSLGSVAPMLLIGFITLILVTIIRKQPAR